MQLSDDQLAFLAALRSNKHTPIQLDRNFGKLPDADRFRTLLHVFTESNHYGHQQTAGKLLVDNIPQCDDSLVEILVSTAPTWNLSVEELPFYLADIFGAQAVVDCAIMLSEKYEENTIERKALETVVWWLRSRLGNGG